ncbi:D-fructose-6-phosphate amidotransferase [Photobacterium lipolyticum]|uniref:D-fructose-6-phosphate amidotransferase n=1 Tax=Photobacterium lipolyticum TaxID=266810 RepID=A0A2T3MZK4_9GAMM|nr:D-fructose-6-phosphate amidotransferase [Photobacterium lipolyticum]PSW05438.1 D-fructose-6-phosphate amidotransferase [Photobacterium lipolyticum]
MSAAKIYFRDLLGLTLIIFSVLTILGVIFDFLALITNINHEGALATTYLYESIPLLLCVFPSFILGKVINRPAWVSETEQYHLQAAKKQ